MASNLPVPEPMSVSGNVQENWNYFKEQWENYLVASGLKEKTGEVQIATFLVVIGKECYQVYRKLALTAAQKANLKAIIEELEKYFRPKSNVTYERFIFNTGRQEARENIDEYVNRLRGLSATCEFGELAESLIRDRIVLGAKHSSVRSRLLTEENLTLEKSIAICRSYELAQKQIKTIDNQAPEEANRIEKKTGYDRYRAPKLHPNQERKLEQCKFCGGRHERDKRKCPAYQAKCHICHKQNHFARMCRNKPQSSPARRIHAIENRESDSDHELAYRTEEAYTAGSKKKWFVSLKVSLPGKKFTPLRCQLDSGSTCNTVSYKDYCNLFEADDEYLNKSSVKLKTYDGSLIIPKGEVELQCQYEDKSCNLHFQVLNKDLTPLLSADTCLKLGLLTLNIEETSRVDTIDSVVDNFSDVFEGLGRLPGKYHIDVDPEVRPVQHCQRNVPVAMKADLKNKLAELVEKKVITPVDQPTDWISSMVVVRRNNKLRICLDPKDLNAAIRRPKYPIPSIEDILPKLAKAKVFSVLDAKNGFWQVELDEQSSHLTCFWTPFGRYRWLRMPFGISSAPEEYQRRQHEVIAGLRGVECIADDILVYGSGDNRDEAVKDHDENLKALLQRAREKNLVFNRDKLRYKLTSVPYMGHLLTSEGLKADPNKIEAVKNMPIPTDVPSVQRFVGFVNYLARFLPKLSELCEPMRRLTDKKVVWKWTDTHQRAFDRICKLVTSAPVLKYFNVNESVVIECDASQVGLGATLLQNDQPVAYASRSLTATEQRYAQIEKECLAIVFACEKFEQYILGKEVSVKSDHKPLEIIFRKPLLQAPKRLQRMLLRLQKFDLNVVYKQGITLHIADFLSRASLPVRNNSQCDNDYCVFSMAAEIDLYNSFEEVNLCENLRLTDQRLTQVREESRCDDTLVILKRVVLNGWPQSRVDCPVEIRQFWPYRDEIVCQDNVLFKGHKVIIPSAMYKDMLHAIHYSHLGADTCLNKAKEVLFWPGISAQVKDFISQCAICNQYLAKQQKEPMVMHDIPSMPWSKAGIDLFTFNCKDYVIMVDYYSDFWELKELTATTSASIVKFCKEQFARYGIVDTLISDNGPQFLSAEFSDFAKAWCFNHCTSSPYHSRSNGKVESAVKIAKTLLKKSHADNSDFMLALLDWRNSPTPEIKTSPVQRLMSKRTKSILPIDSRLLYPKVVENVQNDVLRKREKAKVYYDRTSKPLRDLKEGDVVRVQPLTRSGTWEMGKCIKKVAPRSYLIECNSRIIRRNRKFLRLTNERYVPFDFSFGSNNSEANYDDAGVTICENNARSSNVNAEAPIAVRRPQRNCGPPTRYGQYFSHA